MSIHDTHPPAQNGPGQLNRDTAERLLRGDSAARAGHPRVAGLLDAVAAPAQASELAGEAAAVAAFVAARHSPTPTPRRISMIKATLAKVLTVKVAAACVGFAGVGGVALAASSGSLPDKLPFHAAPSVSHSHSPKPSHSPKVHPTGRPTPTARPSHPEPREGLRKLCREYAAHDRDHRGRDLNDPKFGDLVRNAGRKDRERVDRFCANLDKGPARPTATPSGAAHSPAPHPSGKPSGYPGPRPTGVPTGSADPRPAGR